MSAAPSAAGLAEVRAPPNEEGTRATLLRWCKAAGDPVRKDEPLLELETDKVTVEVPSPIEGELCELLKQPDEDVLPGELLARIRVVTAAAAPDRHEAAPPAATPGAAPEQPQPLLSPAVRRLLAEHALAPADVAGSGHEGRLTVRDIERHLAGAGVPEGARAPLAPQGASARVPHTPIRRRIALHMARSLAEAPHVTTLFEADLTRVLAHRADEAPLFARQGVRLTLTAYFVLACARALRAHPQLNATFHEDALELHSEINVGVGAALGDAGLIVPVVHRADALDLLGTARRLGELVASARAGSLAPAEVRGGTFTLSNHGVGGSLLAAPIIINQPQVAILGVGKVERRVSVLEAGGAESIAIRSKCYLTLTIDHRALDAFQANAFLAHVVNALETFG